MHRLISMGLIFSISFFTTFLVVHWLIPRLREVGLTGKDVNKPDHQEIPEMGGLGITVGFIAGVMTAIMLSIFFELIEIRLEYIFAGLSTILIMSLIGIIDDLLELKQFTKAILPLFAALPLVAVKAGVTTMILPIVGEINFGIFYALVLIPVGIAGASNVTNMLAGFNGLEAGLGAIMCGTIAIVGYRHSVDSMVLAIAMMGALIAFLYYNRYPSKIFMGDIGTLSIGAIIASSVIIGNFETAGIILIIPYSIDFFIKAKNRFPREIEYIDPGSGKLRCPKVLGLPSLLMHLTGGITESKLVLSIIGIELVFALIVISIFL